MPDKTDFKLKLKHLITIKDLTKEEIEGLLQTANNFKAISERSIKKVPTLKGKTIINLFFEPSTRTRTSFEIAGKRLSADVINISAAASSVTKGESLKDTILNICAMKPDLLVIRHSSSGAAEFAANVATCPVINGGDGWHAHPTQSLLDMMTIKEQKGKLKGLKVSIVGDILHSRVARSNIRGLTTMGAEVTLCGPPTMMPKDIATFGCKVTHNIKEAAENADVIMMLRIQLERMSQGLFPSIKEYSNLFCLTPTVMQSAKADVTIMHPGPINRGVEISAEVADGAASVILPQVTHGVAMRMALLYLLCGKGEK